MNDPRNPFALEPKLLASSTGEVFVGRLKEPLSREEEAEVARAVVDGERLLLETLLAALPARRSLVALADELCEETIRSSDVLRNPEPDDPLAARERRDLIRMLRSAKRGSHTQVSRLASRLTELRLHPAVFDRLEAAIAHEPPSSGAQALHRRVRRTKDGIDHAKKKLVEHNLRLVVLHAKRFRNRGLALTDLVQEGSLGLMRAVEKFDYRRGHRLNTYASWWIKQSLERAIADQGTTIRVPVHLTENRARMARVAKTFYARHGQQPTPAELAARTTIPVTKIRTVIALPYEPLSLESPVIGTDDLRLQDRIVNEASPLPENAVATEQMKARARKLLATLGERERTVISLRFGLDGSSERTLEEIGRKLSLTRERIRQIQSNALRKLRARCAADHYRPELDP